MKKVHRPNRREKGFTLIELLVVVAILGVLAAVVVPNVSKFIGSGKSESAKTELQTVQTAVTACLADAQKTTLDASFTYVRDFSATGQATMDDGIPANAKHLSDYLQRPTTKFWYSYDIATGLVKGYYDAAGDLEIGVDLAP
ncbi:MAG: type II secretion system protein [Dehalococcoidia bacterium]